MDRVHQTGIIFGAEALSDAAEGQMTDKAACIYGTTDCSIL